MQVWVRVAAHRVLHDVIAYDRENGEIIGIWADGILNIFLHCRFVDDAFGAWKDFRLDAPNTFDAAGGSARSMSASRLTRISL